MKFIKPIYSLLVILVAAPIYASNQPEPLFEGHETLAVRAVAPFGPIARERSVDEETAGEFLLPGVDGQRESLDVKIRARGNYRRQPSVCDFPPLRFNFKKSQLESTLLEGQDKLKLVTHCRGRSRAHEQATIAEFVVYRMLNVLTDVSFRVRLVHINYADDADDPGFVTYGFFIEDDEHLAARLGMTALDVDRVAAAQFDDPYLNMISVVQYLIGNTDFSQSSGSAGRKCCHNHKPLAAEDGKVFSVPYDFDMAGIVDAPYAEPNPKLRLYSVKERLYRGRCTNNQLLPSTVERLLEKRMELEAVIRNTTELDSDKQEDMLNYLDSFYSSVETPRKFERNLVKKCR